MRVALDTNILAYAEGFQDAEREAAARQLIPALMGRLVIPVQVLGELYNVLIRKAKRDKANVRRSISRWSDVSVVAFADAPVFADAVQLAMDHDLQIWDAVVLATAQSAECGLLLSEDMHHGFAWKSVTVVNPFLDHVHPLLEAALAAPI